MEFLIGVREQLIYVVKRCWRLAEDGRTAGVKPMQIDAASFKSLAAALGSFNNFNNGPLLWADRCSKKETDCAFKMRGLQFDAL